MASYAAVIACTEARQASHQSAGPNFKGLQRHALLPLPPKCKLSSAADGNAVSHRHDAERNAIVGQKPLIKFSDGDNLLVIVLTSTVAIFSCCADMQSSSLALHLLGSEYGLEARMSNAPQSR